MRLFTSESVTPGHPDKLCDRISDAILDQYLARDPQARVAVEVMATAAGLVIAGEVGSTEFHAVDHSRVARMILRASGYVDYSVLPVIDRVVEQSPEISHAVAQSMEARIAVANDAGAIDHFDQVGAGDQGLMFGYAVTETPDLMPLPIAIAHELARRLHRVGLGDDFAAIGPDGKTQVTVRYDDEGRPAGVESVLVSTQHAERLIPSRVRKIVLADVVEPVLARFGQALSSERVLVNPSGSFVTGGPVADAGLTGRKIIVDTYGGAGRHGGGAFSGKDPSKVDRSGAYAARWVAKHVVAAGLASRCEVQVAYAIGSAHPVGLHVETFGTGGVSGSAIASAVRQVFDLRPAAIIDALDLRRPIYSPTAAFGHFGISPDALIGHPERRPWEVVSPARASALRLAATGSATL